jgi:hypothetical protein
MKCLEDDIFITLNGIENIKTGEVYSYEKAPSSYYYNHDYHIFQLHDRTCILFCIFEELSYYETILNYEHPSRKNEWFWSWQGEHQYKYTVLDKNGSVLDSEYDYLQWVDGYFCAAQGNYGGLLRPDGTWFVKVEFEKFVD